MQLRHFLQMFTKLHATKIDLFHWKVDEEKHTNLFDNINLHYFGKGKYFLMHVTYLFSVFFCPNDQHLHKKVGGVRNLHYHSSFATRVHSMYAAGVHSMYAAGLGPGVHSMYAAGVHSMYAAGVVHRRLICMWKVYVPRTCCVLFPAY